MGGLISPSCSGDEEDIWLLILNISNRAKVKSYSLDNN
jgi:hypothetical protein